MELDLSHLTWPLLIVALLATLIALAVFGAMVTPAQAGGPNLISPERWTATRLARQAQAEAQALMHDASQLRNLLQAEQPEPVAAMLLAQRLYAVHRKGTSATTGARQALIDAAEISARYAVGELPRQAAVAALNDALNRIEPLWQQPVQANPEPAPESHLLYVPLVQVGRPASTTATPPTFRTRLITTR